MAFETYNAGQSSSGEKKKIDFEALNQYVVETAGLQKKEVLVGVVAGIIDLGNQKQEDAAMKFDGTAEDEAKAIAEKPDTYFEDMKDPVTQKMARYKRWPQKPTQCIAIAVDFHDIMLQKGQFFGDEDAEPKPLRMYMGGQFFLSSVKKQVVGRPIPLREKKNSSGKWSFDKKHQCYKMAADAGLVDASKDEVFKPAQIDQLLGKAFQFSAQIYFNSGGYYTEDLKYVGALGRGQKAPDVDFEPMLIQFNQDNKPEDLKELRSHVKNTIMLAENYEGSKIQAQLEALYPNRGEDNQEDEPQEKEEKPAAKKEVKKVTKPKVEVQDDLDDEVPF